MKGKKKGRKKKTNYQVEQAHRQATIGCYRLKDIRMKSHILILLCIVVLGVIGSCQGDGIGKNYYKVTCPHAEEIVKNVTEKHVCKNPSLPAKLLRMHFHDCFVRGCDASLLLNSTTNNTAEKQAIPNLTLSGFDVIDDIKAEVEKTCPGVVSCADVLALAARDSVSFELQRPLWEVLTGRRDGRVSRISEALANIPSPFSNFTTLVRNFASKGLDVHDLVVLSGGHTIGIGHCNLFSNRLYNFTGRGDQDPSLNPAYASFLKTKCRSLRDIITTVEMDPRSSLNFDNHYYVILKQKMGLFQSDAALLTDDSALKTVDELLDSSKFFVEFAQSMQKMGAIGVLTGTAGEIRKKCYVVN
ncbi:Peroxidase superfamily protein [Theobroma cacao]|uniref:Peroxidase n=2 Tax=Theobroma cacao TaxID=3641 RepID=A0A061DQB9_THECC|nr:Peroxidase superfamily protein [Theobroma cacao]